MGNGEILKEKITKIILMSCSRNIHLIFPEYIIKKKMFGIFETHRTY